MNILGIETSCDETAVSVIEAYGDIAEDFACKILGNTLLSQAKKHAEFGGVYPNLAKREHSNNLVPVLQKTLQEADMLVPIEKPEVPKEKIAELKVLLEREPALFAQLVMFLAQHGKPDIDAIAVTVGPGLEPALWVGVNFARALSFAWDIPVAPVNHMEGHILISALMSGNEDSDRRQADSEQIPFPALALLISGGHTEMVLMEEWFSYQKIGQTRDDAVGEAFDKVARLLDLPYPGGPEMDRLAKEAREENLSQPYKLPRPMIGSGDDDFSFSGIKTAVRKLVEDIGDPNETQKKQIAREFEDAVVEVFLAKLRTALSKHGIKTLIIGGGVSANKYLKVQIETMVEKEFSETNVFVSSPERATDNGLMIALAGYFHAKRGEFVDMTTLRADGNLSLA